MKPEIAAKNVRNFPDVFVKPLGKCRWSGTLVLLCIALTAAILCIYMQVGNHQFFAFDDVDYVTNNPHIEGGLTSKNIMWAFTSVEAYNWHPITWLSHMTIAQFFGMSPRAHHLTNVAIHATNTLSLFLFLFRLTGKHWQSAFVAALFALHPLHIESVAWVAERKDVLSAFFWFLTLLVYAEYVAKQKPVLYLLALFSFMLGLMSKPMLVTLPIVLLIIDVWPLDRYRYAGQHPEQRQLRERIIALIKEKIPFFACSLLAGVIAIYAQQKGGVVRGLKELSFLLRIENALVAYVKYIGKTLWPHDLAILYPFPESIPLWQVLGSLFLLLFLSVTALRASRSNPYVTVGWLWFLVTLIPVIGIIQVGAQSMADRYTYIPIIGLFIVITWGVPDITKGLKHQKYILFLLAGTVITTLSLLTYRQIDYWQDSISIFRHTLEVTTANAEIHYNLGKTLQAKGYRDEAVEQYQEALRINPNDMDAFINTGNIYQNSGYLDAAIQQYMEALRIAPGSFHVHYNLGLAFQAKGLLDEAVKEYKIAIKLNPDHPNAYNNLGACFTAKGESSPANEAYQQALRFRTEAVSKSQKR